MGWQTSPVLAYLSGFLAHHLNSCGCGCTLKVTGPNPMQGRALAKHPCQSASACMPMVMGGFLLHSTACWLMHQQPPSDSWEFPPASPALLLWALLSGLQASPADRAI